MPPLQLEASTSHSHSGGFRSWPGQAVAHPVLQPGVCCKLVLALHPTRALLVRLNYSLKQMNAEE